MYSKFPLLNTSNIFFCLQIVGDPNSKVHGFVFNNIFEGRIHCGDGNEFHIESAKQYKHLNHTSDVHSVIYNAKDVVVPESHFCGGVHAAAKHQMGKQANSSQVNDGRF